MRKFLALMLPLSLTIATTLCVAQENMRPGLWEVSTSSPLLKLVPAIPPDQMQSLMNMARQHGIDMPKIQNGAASAQTCITPAMAAQDLPPNLYMNQAGCSTSNVSRVGNSYSARFSCSSPKIKGSGTAEGTFTSPGSFTGRTGFDGTVQGTPVNERAEVSGRWLAASCGAVRSVQ